MSLQTIWKRQWKRWERVRQYRSNDDFVHAYYRVIESLSSPAKRHIAFEHGKHRFCETLKIYAIDSVDSYVVDMKQVRRVSVQTNKTLCVACNDLIIRAANTVDGFDTFDIEMIVSL